MPNDQPISLDAILAELGAFGKYNIINYTLLLVPIFLAGFYGSIYVFEAPDIEYRCRINECENLPHEAWIKDAIPLQKNGDPEKCTRFAFNDNVENRHTCTKDVFDTHRAVECDQLVYSEDVSAVKDV